MRNILFGGLLIFGMSVFGQSTSYWQQKVDYKMDIQMDVKTYKYTGKQELTYTNNSPDTLKRVFYHLYPNAFQPGSEMDVRSRTLEDPDPRVGDRISKLSKITVGSEAISFYQVRQLLSLWNLKDKCLFRFAEVGEIIKKE